MKNKKMDNKDKKDILLNIITGIAITSVIGSSLWCMSLVSKETTAQTTTQEPVKIEQPKVEDKQVAKTIKNKNYTEQECSILEYKMHEDLSKVCVYGNNEKNFKPYLEDYYNNCYDYDSFNSDKYFTLMLCQSSIASSAYNNKDYKTAINFYLSSFETEKLTSKINTMKIMNLETVAIAYYELGDYYNAKIYLEKVLKSGKFRELVMYELAGDIYYKLKDSANAKKYYKLALYKFEIEKDNLLRRPCWDNPYGGCGEFENKWLNYYDEKINYINNILSAI